VLNGIKNWITNGTTADVYFLQAMTDDQKAHRDISTFLIEKEHGIELGVRKISLVSEAQIHALLD
jgi:alkylation response protein AidB-like acyl-CoA dehydrogenase